MRRGLNWWFNPNFVMKLSYHYVRGNLFATAESKTLSILTPDREKNTRLVLLGTQFSF